MYQIGHPAVLDLFDGHVIVQEKIDGSQFSFELGEDGIHCRSKGKDQSPGQTDEMFLAAVEFVESIKGLLAPGATYRCEYLQKPKHNTLCYERVPDGNLVLFDVNTGLEIYRNVESVEKEASRLGMTPVPTILMGTITKPEDLLKLLDRESVLGGCKIEGVVVKNYDRFGRDGKALMGKYVSEAFKERHGKDWKDRHPGGKDILGQIAGTFNKDAIWEKAVQHLRDNGKLTGECKDIGPLVKEVMTDVHKEGQDEIKAALFKWAWKDISRQIVHGLPDWYKRRLIDQHFEAKP